MSFDAEQLLVLSIRLLKTAQNSKMAINAKGSKLQKISKAQGSLLEGLSMPANSAIDSARLVLARLLRKTALSKTRLY